MRASIVALFLGFLLWMVFGTANPYQSAPDTQDSAIAKDGDEKPIANYESARSSSRVDGNGFVYGTVAINPGSVGSCLAYNGTTPVVPYNTVVGGASGSSWTIPASSASTNNFGTVTTPLLCGPYNTQQ